MTQNYIYSLGRYQESQTRLASGRRRFRSGSCCLPGSGVGESVRIRLDASSCWSGPATAATLPSGHFANNKPIYICIPAREVKMCFSTGTIPFWQPLLYFMAGLTWEYVMPPPGFIHTVITKPCSQALETSF